MVHGAPDNYQVQQKVTTYRLDDMAELAVRLGSPINYDRMGDVLAYESFENGNVRTILGGAGANTIKEITGVYAKTRGFSAHLRPHNIGQNQCNIHLYTTPIDIGKIGYEASFTCESDLSHIILYFDVYDGSNRIQVGIKYDHVNTKLYYLDEDNNYTDADIDVYLQEYPIMWNTIKFVIDIDNNKYTRVRTNNKTYSLTDIPIRKINSFTFPHLVSVFYVYNKADTTCDIYIDDIIITQNEP